VLGTDCLDEEILSLVLRVTTTLWPDIPIDSAKKPSIMKAIENRTVSNPTVIAGKKITVNPTPITKRPKMTAIARDQPDILVDELKDLTPVSLYV
jgi:hypothetical protein